MQIKITKNKFYGYLCAFAGILSMNPYFLWPSFAGGVLVYFTYILYIISISYLIKSSARFRLSKSNFLIGVLFLIMYTHIFVLGATGISAQTLIS